MLLGTLEVEGRPMPIRHIGLQQGLIVFTVAVTGPVSLPASGRVRVSLVVSLPATRQPISPLS